MYKCLPHTLFKYLNLITLRVDVIYGIFLLPNDASSPTLHYVSQSQARVNKYNRRLSIEANIAFRITSSA